MGKHITENHYKLYDMFSDEMGDIYTTSNAVLYVIDSIHSINYIYFNKENNYMNYMISVIQNESLNIQEIEEFVDKNESNKPESLFDYLHNFQKIRDINDFSHIDISANTETETVGEISIVKGNLKEFDITEKNSEHQLNMTMNRNNKEIETKIIKIEKASIEDLDENLKSIYESGKQFVKTINKKIVNPSD